MGGGEYCDPQRTPQRTLPPLNSSRSPRCTPEPSSMMRFLSRYDLGRHQSEPHRAPNSTTVPSIAHRRRPGWQRQPPKLAISDPRVSSREASVSSSYSGSSMDGQHSPASSATSPNRPGTNRPSPAPLSVHEASPIELPPLETWPPRLPSLHTVLADQFGDSLLTLNRDLAEYSISPPSAAPPRRVSPPQRSLPHFDLNTLIPTLPPPNLIERDAPYPRFGPDPSCPAYQDVSRPAGEADPRSPSSRPPSYDRHHRYYPGIEEERRSPPVRDGTTRPRRRGNLPKEVTELLREWFYGHIGHPYPTEQEKQDLVRATGLKLAQISNWFINARRRKLPKINREAEAEAQLRGQLGASSNLAFQSVPLDGTAHGNEPRA